MSGYIVTDFQLSIKEGKLDDFKATIAAYRKEQIGSRQIEMTMEAVGPIRVDVGI